MLSLPILEQLYSKDILILGQLMSNDVAQPVTHPILPLPLITDDQRTLSNEFPMSF